MSDLLDMFKTYAAFQRFIEGQLEGLYGHGKGDPWQEFTLKLMPLTSFGKKFQNYKANAKKTRDSGWDVRGISADDDSKRFMFSPNLKCQVKTRWVMTRHILVT